MVPVDFRDVGYLLRRWSVAKSNLDNARSVGRKRPHLLPTILELTLEAWSRESPDFFALINPAILVPILLAELSLALWLLLKGITVEAK